jgi:hypothetical protein
VWIKLSRSGQGDTCHMRGSLSIFVTGHADNEVGLAEIFQLPLCAGAQDRMVHNSYQL